MDTGKIVTIAGIIGAVVTLGGFAWAFGDNTGYRPVLKKEFIGFMSNEFKMAQSQTELNTLAIAKQQFQMIEERKDRGAELTWEEKRDYCINAKILRFPVAGCLPDGSGPDLTQTIAPQQ